MTTPAQTITLTVPGDRRFVGIVRMFVGGLAARLGLGYETMDDLQLALESVVRDCAADALVTVEACIDGDTTTVAVGPLARDPLAPDSARPDSLAPERLLAALVAGAESFTRDGACWLRLDVRIPAGSGSA
jgi:hypothetical protein